MRRLTLLALLALALAGPAHAAPAPLAVLAAHTPAGRVVSWRPTAGQWAACVFRLRDGQVLGCVRGQARSLTIPRGGDAELQGGVAPVQVRVYGRGGELARGRSWAVALPTVRR